MTGMNRISERGAVNAWMIVSISLIVVTLLALGAMTWALITYFDLKGNYDSKVATEVAAAKKEQADADATQYEIEKNKTVRPFVGPEDFGALEFDYPRDWSAYIDNDASRGGTFEAYLNPVEVPPISNTTRYALRVTIETKSYETVVKSYESLVKRGDLKSSAVKVNGQDATRLDGNFTKDIRGSAVVFKIRDKVVTLRTDADTFGELFNAIIASTTFNS
jgi:hypothetical protein